MRECSGQSLGAERAGFVLFVCLFAVYSSVSGGEVLFNRRTDLQ